MTSAGRGYVGIAMKTIKMQVEAGSFSVSGSQVRLRLKTGFAFSHLKIATKSAHAAHKIEQENAGAEFGPWFDGILEVVPVAVVMAAAALESNANEILQEIIDGHAGIPITPSRRQLLKELKDDRSGNAMMKYRRLALFLDVLPDEGPQAWQNAKLLVRFRNEFMHFKPAWDDEDVHSGDFVEQMRKRVRTVDAYKQNFIFPYGLMTYDCARWAVMSVVGLSAEFCKLINVKDRFTLPGLDFSLP